MIQADFMIILQKYRNKYQSVLDISLLVIYDQESDQAGNLVDIGSQILSLDCPLNFVQKIYPLTHYASFHLNKSYLVYYRHILTYFT